MSEEGGRLFSNCSYWPTVYLRREKKLLLNSRHTEQIGLRDNVSIVETQ